jgi:hypothetical protein
MRGRYSSQPDVQAQTCLLYVLRVSHISHVVHRRTSCIPEALLADYQKLLSSNPSRRLNPAKERRVL